MAAATIDYDKLAQQSGAKGIDYDALAAQHGAIVAPTTTAPTAPADNRNLIQRGFDSLVTPKGGNDPVTNSLERFGAGALEGAGNLFVHPLKSLQGMALNAPNVIDPTGLLAKTLGTPTPQDTLSNAIAQPARTAGNVVGGATLGEGAGAFSRGSAAAAPAMEDVAYRTINHAIDAGPKLTRYGANPGRGLIQEGIAPSFTKSGLVRKIGNELPIAGAKVGDAVNRFLAPVPGPAIANSIEAPISQAGEVMSGFGGGRDTSPLANFWASTENAAPGASGPIYGPNAPSLVSPVDLWQSIQNLDKNTRFSPDPEIEGVNEVRRDVRGGLRNNLEDAAPGVKPASQRYADLRTADDALSRSTLPGLPKSKTEALAFPLTTFGATGLAKAGGLARGVSAALPENPFVYTGPVLGANKKKD